MNFLLNNMRFLGFGLTLAFLSSFGQTYFIGVYRPAIAEEFALSNSEFGLYYLCVTIVSAVGLNRLGHIIDRANLVPYTMTLLVLTAVACGLVGLAGPFWVVVVGLMAVRLMGQGMLTHAAMTSMSRYYDRNRGFAVAIAGLGFPIGQAVLPPLAVTLMQDLEWRTGWFVFAALILVVALPIIGFLLKGHQTRHKAWLAKEAAVSVDDGGVNQKHARRKNVIRDPRFYLMLPALIAGPFWITAAFFFADEFGAHAQMVLADYTRFYGLYAVGSIAAPFMGGLLVDKLGGKRLMFLYPPLFGLALLALQASPSAGGVIIFMFLMGLGAGITLPINNAVWAELYGTKHLGEIKSLATSLVVVSTALAPYFIGILLDHGIDLSRIMVMGAIYCFVATLLVVPMALQSLRLPVSRK
ncbi:MAG: MFS transporter [Kordiimonadaceae bacterium]|nr:MFS transporter [Kordiimonadaceae bacterium]MBO6568193.1 MFS transporter [Kordiimonadaceae bacterium]MBO6964077.1 MFS transporter [Kordiimonadaceae bacterium]